MVTKLTSQSKARQWFLIGFGYLLLTAIMGTLLRLQMVDPFSGLPYDHLLHAHSHTGMLGWVYSALFTALLFTFHPHGFWQKRYQWLFYCTQVANVGMLVTFLMQGYGPYSIACSTLHILLSYGFSTCFFLDTKHLIKDAQTNRYALYFAYGGLIFLVLSSFGPWGLGIIASQGLKNTDLYDQAIYFYLHFQYNGWFIMTLIGLWIAPYLTGQKQQFSSAFHLLCWPMVPAYALSLLGFDWPLIVLGVALGAALLQMTGAGFLVAGFREKGKGLPKESGVVKWLWWTIVVFFVAKWLFQLVGALPVFHSLSYQNRAIVIGYLHLNMLGIVTGGLLYWFYKQKLIKLNGIFGRWGLGSFLIGLIFTIGLLFLQGFLNWWAHSGIPGFEKWALAMHCLALLGIVMLGIRQFQDGNE